MTSLLNNSTVGTILSGSTSTSNYGLPSSSFTHQKQPIMPSDQKAKLLAMHRDGKANAGIYVAVVLLVYFVLVILLLCRYGKRRRSTTSDLVSGIDSTAEQGRFTFFSFHTKPSCGGSGCCGSGCWNCLKFVFCCNQCTTIQRDNALLEKPVTQNKLTNERGMIEFKTTPKLNGSSVAPKDGQIPEKMDEIGQLAGSKLEADQGQRALESVMMATVKRPEELSQIDSENGETTEED